MQVSLALRNCTPRSLLILDEAELDLIASSADIPNVHIYVSCLPRSKDASHRCTQGIAPFDLWLGVLATPTYPMNKTPAFRHAPDPPNEDLDEDYTIERVEGSGMIHKIAREILGGNMKGLSMDINDGTALEAIGKLCAEFGKAMLDRVKYRYLLTNRGGNAQKLVNILQMLLDYPLLDPSLRAGLLKVLMRVSTRASVFPTCLTLHDLQFDREPISDGFWPQIWKGTMNNHTVALKVIKIYREKHVNNLLMSLFREGMLWAHLCHPNIIPFYGIYHLHDSEEQVCLVSPWMNEGNVTDFLSRNPRADRIKIVFEIAKGIEYLHENNIIHGDLKGANVLITDTGQAILCDFGLSTVTVDVDVMAYTSVETIPQCRGTLRYQAPELFAADSEDETEPKLTMACDIYSFSCLCYEIFTGKLPFYEMIEPAAMIQVISGNRPSRSPADDPSWNYWGLTDDIWASMEKCWSQSSLLRPSSTDIVHAFRLNVLENDDNSSHDDGDGLTSSSAFRHPLYDIRSMSAGGYTNPEPNEDWKDTYTAFSTQPFTYNSHGLRLWRARSILTMRTGSGSMYTDPSIYSYGTDVSNQQDASLRLKAPSIISTALSTLSEDTFYAGRSQDEPYKVLLLGASQTRKSTVIKQLKIAYGGGYTDSERESMLDIVFLTFIKAVRTVHEYMYADRISGGISKETHQLQHIGDDIEYDDGVRRDVYRMAIKFLAEPVVAARLKSDWLGHKLESSQKYFLNNPPPFQKKDYLPSDEDIIHATATTTGIWETDIKLRNIYVRIFDVGGTRSERRKWINRYQSITSVIFCVALDDYYKVLAEDGHTNRMEDSITLFKAVHKSSFFAGKPTILLLNKFDLFKEALQKIPIEDPTYDAGTDASRAISFILKMFTDRVASVHKPIYPHLLQATDLRNIRQVFRTVRDEILMTALEDHVYSSGLID